MVAEAGLLLETGADLPSRPVTDATASDCPSSTTLSKRSPHKTIGFVGEATPIAGEYHKPDFDWEILKEDGEAIVARQRREWAEAQEESNALPIPTKAEQSNHQSLESDAKGSFLFRNMDPSLEIDFPGRENLVGDPNFFGGWEAFHKRHSSARFFKEKRYIPLAFPMLMQKAPPGRDCLHVAEIGCGCGSALLPVLKANPAVRVTACDLSPTAVELFKAAAERAGIDQERVHAFSFDASNFENSNISEQNGKEEQFGIDGSKSLFKTSPLAGIGADCLLMIFTLSALWPRDMLNMLRQAYDALRPGGVLLFRDYGLYDMTQLRAHGRKLLDPEELVYQRLDGTLSYYFSKEKIVELTSKVGFVLEDFEYSTTLMINRKKGNEMRRVHVTAVFKKPEE